jgi:hypothetical protein
MLILKKPKFKFGKSGVFEIRLLNLAGASFETRAAEQGLITLYTES